MIILNTTEGIKPGVLFSLILGLVGLIPIACRPGNSTTGGWKTYSLGGGKVSVSVPPDYRQSMESDETLLLTPPNDPGVSLRFNLHLLDDPGLPPDIGTQFVRDQAKKKKLSVTENAGKVLLTESSNQRENGVKVEMRFWQIGFQNAVVVMSATIIDSKREEPAVKEFLEKTVPAIIDSMKKR